jgi:hypothetical protein
MVYAVQYSGAFGFIKPWTAVRDELTYSQQFLTPSIVEGLEKKLFPELLSMQGLQGRIVRHRLSCSGIDIQQEQTQPRAIKMTEKKLSRTGDHILKTYTRPMSILKRGVLLDPVLWLVFAHEADAHRAAQQHICLCRNEDILLPTPNIVPCSEEDFDRAGNGFDGFELRFQNGGGIRETGFLVGYNRYDSASPMYGEVHIVGTPIREYEKL